MKAEVEFLREFTGHRGAVYALFQGSKPDLIYSASGDGYVVEWDLQSPGDGKAVARTGTVIYAATFHPEAYEIIAGTKGIGLFRFNPDTRKQTGQGSVAGDYFDLLSFDDGSILSACGNGFIYQDALDGDGFLSQRAVNPTDKSARCLALHPTEPLLATGWSDGRIRVYHTGSSQAEPDNLARFRELYSFPANEPSVFCLLFLPDGKTLISGGRDAQLKVWDTTDYSLVKAIPAHWFTVNHLVLSPDQTMFASASRDKSIKIWDAQTFDLLKVIDLRQYPAHTHSVNRLLWIEYDNLLISAGDDKKIKVWRVAVR
jgi:WD40 repeat protein